MRTKQKTKTHFRKFVRGVCKGEVIAIFPEIPHDPSGEFCMSYMQVGQHGAAYPGPLPDTVPAKPEESESLRKELAIIGYDIQEVSRISYKMHLARRNNAR